MKKKLTEKTTWFRNKKKRDEPTRQEKRGKGKGDKKEKHSGEAKAVIFIPYTPNSQLAKEMREKENMPQEETYQEERDRNWTMRLKREYPIEMKGKEERKGRKYHIA